MYKNIAVVGLGNILMKDEGVGVWIVRELAKRNLPQNIDIIDGGTASFDIFSSIGALRKLIIIDALQGGEKPGTVYRLYPEDLCAPSNSYISLHHMHVMDTLNSAKIIGCIPQETVIIGVEPKEIDWGLGVTEDIKRKIPEIIEIVVEEVENDRYRKETDN